MDNVMKMEEHSAVKLAGLISPSSPSNLSTAEIPLRFASNHSKLQYLAVLLLQSDSLPVLHFSPESALLLLLW